VNEGASSMSETENQAPPGPEVVQTAYEFRTTRDLGAVRRFFLWFGLIQQLAMMAAGLWPAAWLVLHFRSRASTPGHWVLLILGAVLVFNYGYLVALLIVRLVVPRPKEGFYPVAPGKRLPGQAALYVLNLLLVKARYEPPWAATFSSVLANSFPLRPLFTRLFGPRSRSMTMGDTVYLIDPFMVEIGRNAVLGFHCVIIGHVFDNRGLLVRKIRIGDRAVVGGETTIMAGVQVGHHAVVRARSLVPPETVIGPYEYWAGVPAKKIKDLSPDGESAAPGSEARRAPKREGP